MTEENPTWGSQMTHDKLSEELLLCPFCGGLAEVWQIDERSTGHEVACADIRCNVKSVAWGMTKVEAITAWNTRVLRSATPMPEVKPLEWSEPWPADDLQASYASRTGHMYSVMKIVDDDGWICTVRFWACGNEIYLGGVSKSSDEAKAAAQADYEARILSALTAPSAREISEAEVEIDEIRRVSQKMASRLGLVFVEDPAKVARFREALERSIAAALEAARSPS